MKLPKSHSSMAIMISSLVSSLIISFIVFSLVTDKQETQAKSDNEPYFYEQPYHLKDYIKLENKLNAVEIESNESEDYALYRVHEISVNQGDYIFTPALGHLTVSKVTDTLIYCTLEDEHIVYNGMSGDRVLSSDYKYTLGFISSVEEGELLIVKVRNSY